MGDLLEEVSLHNHFEVNKELEQGGIQRTIEVRLKVEDPTDPYIEQLGQEIELSLDENSVGTIPYRVNII